MRLIDYTVAKEGSADNAATNTCYECLTQGINGSQDEGGHLLKFMFNRPDVSRATGRLKTIMASPLNAYMPSTAASDIPPQRRTAAIQSSVIRHQA